MIKSKFELGKAVERIFAVSLLETIEELLLEMVEDDYNNSSIEKEDYDELKTVLKDKFSTLRNMYDENSKT